MGSIGSFLIVKPKLLRTLNIDNGEGFMDEKQLAKFIKKHNLFDALSLPMFLLLYFDTIPKGKYISKEMPVAFLREHFYDFFKSRHIDALVTKIFRDLNRDGYLLRENMMDYSKAHSKEVAKTMRIDFIENHTYGAVKRDGSAFTKSLYTLEKKGAEKIAEIKEKYQD